MKVFRCRRYAERLVLLYLPTLSQQSMLETHHPKAVISLFEP